MICDTCGRSSSSWGACSYGNCTQPVDAPPPRKPLDLTNPAAVARARRDLVASAQHDIEHGTSETDERIRRLIEER